MDNQEAQCWAHLLTASEFQQKFVTHLLGMDISLEKRKLLLEAVETLMKLVEQLGKAVDA